MCEYDLENGGTSFKEEGRDFSGPVDWLVSSDSRSFKISSVFRSKVGIGGWGLFYTFGVIGFSL